MEGFCVSPGLRGKGLGSAFMKQNEKEIKEMGHCGIFLASGSIRKNGFDELSAHVSFYKRLKE